MKRLSSGRISAWRWFGENAGASYRGVPRITWADYKEAERTVQSELQLMLKDAVLVADHKYIRVGNGNIEGVSE